MAQAARTRSHCRATGPDGLRRVAPPLSATDGRPDAKPIPGIEQYNGAREPVFSPSGKEIAFYSFADQTLKRMPVAGGHAQTICEADTPTGMTGARTAPSCSARAGMASGASGKRRPAHSRSVSEDEEAHGPQLLPDGDHFVFTIATGRTRPLGQRADRRPVTQQAGRSQAPRHQRQRRAVRRRPGRHLVYAVSGNVYAVPFDPDRPRRTAPVVVQDGVSRAAGSFTGAANFSVSDNGTFVYVPGPARRPSARWRSPLRTRSRKGHAAQAAGGRLRLSPRVSRRNRASPSATDGTRSGSFTPMRFRQRLVQPLTSDWQQ